jgi:hypothetical protein
LKPSRKARFSFPSRVPSRRSRVGRHRIDEYIHRFSRQEIEARRARPAASNLARTASRQGHDAWIKPRASASSTPLRFRVVRELGHSTPQRVQWFTAVLDGGVAVRCNPKPALAGLKSRSRSFVVVSAAGGAALKAWSCAAATFEPCQVRKEAAVRSTRRVPQGCRAGASEHVVGTARRSTTGARPFIVADG